MRSTAVAIFLILGLAVGLRAQNANPEQEIRAAYGRYVDALRHKDLPAAMELVDPSFSGRLADGVVLDFAAQEESLRELILYTTTIGDAKVDIERVQMESSDATVTLKCVLFYATTGEKPDSFADDHLRDTWTNTSKGWKLKRSVYLRYTINGTLTATEPPSIASPQLAALAKEWNAGNKTAVDAFWKSVDGKAPLVEDTSDDKEKVLVTFLWRGDADTKKILLQGGLPANGEKPLSRLAETDVWYRTERMPKRSRGTYGFQFEGTFTDPAGQHFTATAPDPLNPRIYGGGSFYELADAPAQPYLTEQPGTPKGTLTRLTIKSTILNNEERGYAVYTPAGFDPKAQPYNLLVVFDGEESGSGVDNLVPTPVILDNLIAQKKIPPTVLLLVNYVSQAWRRRDLACSQPLADFLAKELLGEVRTKYNVSADPVRVIVAGKSFGGLAAACVSLMHPEAFGNVLSLSGSYWYVPDWQKSFSTLYLSDTGWVMQEYAKRPRLPLRFYMVVGRFEGAANQLATNRHLRDILRLKGYPVTYSEFDGGHDSLCWRGSMADGLIALAGMK